LRQRTGGFTFVRVSTEEDLAARLLVVEDDPEARATFDLLLGARWALTLVDRGDDARDRALAQPFDLVLANAQMPGLSGIDLVRLLRANRPTQDLPLILMSPPAGQRETIAGLEAGADDYLMKPFSGRELLVRVQTRLELTAMRRRNAQQEQALAGLKRSLHARDEFLSAASHELRTPITTLSLQTDGLLNAAETPTNGHNTPVNDRLRRRLSAIRRQVVRLNQLVDQLLDVSQFT
jgi:DNA-binding response OmpR family regulator